MTALRREWKMFLTIICLFSIASGQQCFSKLMSTEMLAVCEVVVTLEQKVDLSVSNEPDQPDSQTGEKIRKFHRDLLRESRELADKINAAQANAVRTHKREQQEMSKRDELSTQNAFEMLKAIRDAVQKLNNPGVQAVEVKMLLSITFPGSKGSGISIPEGTMAVINRQNAGLFLAQAEREYQRLSRFVFLPLEIRQRQQRALEEYRFLEKELNDKTTALCKDALQSIRQLENNHTLLDGEMTRWQEQIDLLTVQADKSLQEIRQDYPRASRVEPIDYWVQPSSGSAESRGVNSKVVVRARLRTAYFVPSMEEHRKLNTGIYRLSLAVLDLNLFKLITENGQTFVAHEFVEPHTWPGRVLTKTPLANIKARRSRANRWCVISHDLADKFSSTMVIKIAWLLHPQECAAPFKLQFGRFEPVPISDRRLEPSPSEQILGEPLSPADRERSRKRLRFNQ